MTSTREKTGPLLIAHRGASYDAPENTLASVGLAWEQGADAVEIDVRRSRDGHVVVYHDATTGRTGGDNRKVSEQTLAELKALDVGSHKGDDWAAERIPTLDEVMQAVPEGRRLIVEIKCDAKALPAIKTALDKSGLSPVQLEFIGSDLETMKTAKELFQAHRVLWLCTFDRTDTSRSPEELSAETIHKVREAGLDGLDVKARSAIDKAFVDGAGAAGLKVYVWTVNNAEEAKRLADAGVDGITTDRPQWLRNGILTRARAGKRRSAEFLSFGLRLPGIIAAAGCLAAVGTVAGFASGLWWPFDLACHFRVQYLVTLASAALLLALTRKKVWAAVLAAFALMNLAVIAPLYFSADRPPLAPDVPTYRVFLLNVLTSNTRYDKVEAALRDYSPDFILLQEVNSTWLDNLAGLRKSHPFSLERPRGDNFGIAFFSRLPLTGSRIVTIGEADVPSVCAQVKLDGDTLTVVGIHALPPRIDGPAVERNDQLEAIPAFLEGTRSPVLVMGDLNVTPWSAHFRRLLAESGLCDSARGFGVQPTFPSATWPLRIPIDHCLHSKHIVITERQRGPDLGSDHLPVIVTFAILPP